MNKFKPYVAANKKMKEFTLRATVLGILFGIFFALGNAYLGLKIGTTISASIPAAILSMTVLRVFFRNSTILENNIVQTIATVGEALAAGVVFTVPAIFLLGEIPSLWEVFFLTVIGGILGILFMIPMRRHLIVDEHGKLPFPEGTACAEILKAGEKKGHSSSILAVWSFFISLFYKLCTNILFLWDEMIYWTIAPFEKTVFSLDATPALIGIGYIIGPRISTLLLAGSALSWWVIIPLIHMFASNNLIIFPSDIPVAKMTADEIWGNYVRYIGAGTVAVGGFLSLIKIFPLIIKTIKGGMKELLSGFKNPGIRTDKDISLAWVVIGSIAAILLLWVNPIISLNMLTVALIVILGLFFVALTSITVGIIGSTSNPTSGMTMTTLLITGIIFLFLGWTQKIYLIQLIIMSCIVNVAISMAGTTSQDLKTGFLIGATPRYQQLAEIIGVFVPAAILGYTVLLLNNAYTLGSMQMPAPQAVLVSMIAKGVILKQLPFILVGIGIIIGLLAASIGVPVLPLAMGIYLPLSLNTATMVGGILAIFAAKHKRKEELQYKGVLISSGLIGADALMGIFIALLTILNVIPAAKTALLPNYFSLIIFILLALLVFAMSSKKSKQLH